MIRGKNRMPDYWEWACDYCGKVTRTNSAATHPAGWVPKPRKGADSHHHFCSEEHMAEFAKGEAPAAATEQAGEPVPAPAAEG
jgi:hypothetical protein